MGEVFRSSMFEVKRHNKNTSVPPASLFSAQHSFMPSLLGLSRTSTAVAVAHIFHLRHSTLLCHSRGDEQRKFTALFVDLETRVIKECYGLGIGENAGLLFDSWGLVDVDVHGCIAAFHSPFLFPLSSFI
jgi:hypothetical protein